MKVLICLFLIFTTTSSFATTTDLTEVLKRRNNVSQMDINLFQYLYDQDVQDRLNLWINHRENKDYVVSCQMWLKGYVKSEKILSLACYVLRAKNGLDRSELFNNLIDRYIAEKELILQETKDDRRYEEEHNENAKTLLELYTEKNKTFFKQCLSPIVNANYKQGFDHFSFHSSTVASCIKAKSLQMPSSIDAVRTSIFSFAANLFPQHPGHAISDTGWISGNRVKYLAYNVTSEEKMLEVQEGNALVKNNYPLETKGSLQSLLNLDLKSVFSENGFSNLENDPTWNSAGTSKYGDIFYEMKNAIQNAKESIFINVFFLGGNMGQAIAKELIKKADDGVKVLIIKDTENHFGYKVHMQPVFNYLQAYMFQKSKNGEKSNLLIAPSYILGHKSGLPRLISRLLNDQFIEAVGLKNYLPLHPKATSDHSKVVVIDGTIRNGSIISKPIAFVGSKNWTDQSGALCYDEVAKIEGPAAAVILDDYYMDIFYAFKHNVSANDLNLIAEPYGIKSSSKEEIISKLIKDFDLLGRDKDHNVIGNHKVLVSNFSENISLRTGYNNFNSTRTNVLDEVIQSISMAKRKILIKDQYIFDRHVIAALIKAKKKKPSLDIRIIVGDFLPNYIYADLLAEADISIRFKKAIINEEISQEFHMKTLSIDGENVITGSANKDQTTMYGSFREEQVQIMDKKATLVHDETFENLWNNPNEVTPDFTEFSYDNPKELKALKDLKDQKGYSLSPAQAMTVLRSVIAILYDSLEL